MRLAKAPFPGGEAEGEERVLGGCSQWSRLLNPASGIISPSLAATAAGGRVAVAVVVAATVAPAAGEWASPRRSLMVEGREGHRGRREIRRVCQWQRQRRDDAGQIRRENIEVSGARGGRRTVGGDGSSRWNQARTGKERTASGEASQARRTNVKPKRRAAVLTCNAAARTAGHCLTLPSANQAHRQP